VASCYRVSAGSVKRLIHSNDAQLWHRYPNGGKWIASSSLKIDARSTHPK